MLTGIQRNKTIWGGPDGATVSDVGTRTSQRAIRTFSKVGLTSSATRERGAALALAGPEATYRGGRICATIRRRASSRSKDFSCATSTL